MPFFASFRKFATSGLGLLTSLGNLFTADSNLSVDVSGQKPSGQANSELHM